MTSDFQASALQATTQWMVSSPARPALWAHTSPSLGVSAASPVEEGFSPSTRGLPPSRTVRPKVRGQLLRDTFPDTTKANPKVRGGGLKTPVRDMDDQNHVTYHKETAARLKTVEHRKCQKWEYQHLKGIGRLLKGEVEEDDRKRG